jgi:steroid Delta-isomerase
MPDDAARKALALEYCRRMNAGDVAGVVDLFARDAVLEDPVGSTPVRGRAAFRPRFAQAVAGQVREVPGRPVGCLDGRHVMLPASVSVGGPGLPAGKRVESTVMGLMEVGDEGLIESLRVFWGKSDVSVLAGSEPGEARRKALAVEHCERINAGDVEGLLKLYSPRVRFEDPVGSWKRSGLEALRAHATLAVGNGVHEATGLVVGAQDGRHAAVEVRATMDYLPSGPLLARHGFLTAPPPADPAATKVVVDYVMVIGVGPDGLIDEMRAYWGPTDAALVPVAAAA